MLSGNGDILVEWRRPALVHGEVDYYVLYYKSPEDNNYYKRRISSGDMSAMSGSFLAQLTNLNNFTTYNLAVSAVTKSTKAPGKLYESQFSSYHRKGFESSR